MRNINNIFSATNIDFSAKYTSDSRFLASSQLSGDGPPILYFYRAPKVKQAVENCMQIQLFVPKISHVGIPTGRNPHLNFIYQWVFRTVGIPGT